MGARKQKSGKHLSQTDYESLSAFRHALQQFLKFSEEAARAVGLTPTQHQALLAIKGFPGRERVTNGELAKRLHIKHHSAVGLINRLEAQGLVIRKKSDSDRREVYVTLTQRGADLIEQLTAVHQEELRQIAPQLSGVLESVLEKK
jgi:DNA-binding MarR family transcriptional regulator